MIKGIDLSVHNKKIDFKKIKQDGIDTVIIKGIEEVEFLDKKLGKNYKIAKTNGLNIGFYHFLDIETNKMNRSAREILDRCIEFLERFEELINLRC